MQYDNVMKQELTSNPSLVDEFAYTARRLHDRSGLYYYRARFYSPELGRFITQDPIGMLGGVNLYAYVGNDPVNWVDPYGLCEIDPGVVAGDIQLPRNPSELGPDWFVDPQHKPPHGIRYRHPSGRYLDFHKAQPRKPGMRGKDHYHDYQFGNPRRHLEPGAMVPGPIRGGVGPGFYPPVILFVVPKDLLGIPGISDPGA